MPCSNNIHKKEILNFVIFDPLTCEGILLFECLCYDSEQRPTCEEILKFIDEKSVSKFIRNNPEKVTNKKLDTNQMTILVTNDNTMIKQIHNVDAQNFWKKYFGENVKFY
jgi:hypothetical protein